MSWNLPQQSLKKKMLFRLAYNLILWRHFLSFIFIKFIYLFTLQPNTSPSPPSTYLHKSSLIPLRRGSPALDVKPFHPLDLVPHALHQAAAELSAFSPIEARQSCPFRVVRSIGRQVGRQQAQGQPLL